MIEDVAIAYGFNNVTRRVPPTNTPGKQLPVNQLSDLLRDEIAQTRREVAGAARKQQQSNQDVVDLLRSL